MTDLEQALRDAWKGLKSKLLSDPAELAARLARRQRAVLRRPPRAWCLAVRASDNRIHPDSAIIVPQDAAYPGRADLFREHEVTLDSPLLRRLCRPVTIDAPGQTPDEIAAMLGITPMGLHSARLKGIFRAHYIPGLAARRGRPVPLLYTDRPLDPGARHFAEPDALWTWTARYMLQRIPKDLEQTLTRISYYRSHVPSAMYAENRHPELDLAPAKAAARRLPPPPPDYVWYKWDGAEYLGYDRRNPAARAGHARRTRQAELRHARYLENRRNKPKPSTSRGSLHFNGWHWLCPACGKTCRTIFYPLPPVNLLPDLTHLAQIMDIPRGIDRFACRQCHRIHFFSRVQPDCWNVLVAYLTGGLLYGSEVPRPSWFTPDRKRPYAPHPNAAPSRRRPQVMQLLLKGLTYAQIGQQLGLAERTINDYASKIYAQHRVHSRYELARSLGVPLAPPPSKKEQVRRLLAAGLTVHEIAARMGVTKQAVEHHIAFLCQDAKVRDRHALAEKFGWPVHRYRRPSPQRDTVRHLLSTGLSVKQIARKMRLSLPAVRGHLSALRIENRVSPHAIGVRSS